MKLKDFLKVIAVGMPFTVGTESGTGWVFYYDGKNKIDIPEYFSDRQIELIYPREAREKMYTCCELKAGLAIIVEGFEDGEY